MSADQHDRRPQTSFVGRLDEVAEIAARLAARRGDAVGALRLAGATEALRASIHLPVSKSEQAAFDEWFAPARAALGPAADAAVEEALRLCVM